MSDKKTQKEAAMKMAPTQKEAAMKPQPEKPESIPVETREITVSLLNDIGNYLGEKPYKEVAQLIARLHREANPQS